MFSCSSDLSNSLERYIRSEQCSDAYTFQGEEKLLWHAIDSSACAGASISESLAEKWMPTDVVPLGCPLKDVSTIAIREGTGLGVNLCNAHQIHIHVDGGFSPDEDFVCEADSSNATWAIAVVAVDEHMRGKLMCTSGGHITFNNMSDVFLAKTNRALLTLSYMLRSWLDYFSCSSQSHSVLLFSLAVTTLVLPIALL